MARVFNSKLLLFIIAVLLISNIAMLLFWYKMSHEDHRPHGGDMGRSPMSVFLETRVGFSKEQMTRFEQLRSDQRQKLKPMFEDLKVAKIGFYRLLNVAAIPDSQVQSESLKIGLKQQALDLQTFHNFKQLREICTEQQKPVYDSLIPGVVSDMWFPSRRGGPRPPNDSSRSSRP